MHRKGNRDKLKMDERSKCETRFHQNPRGEHRQHLFELGHSNFLQDTSMKAREKKTVIKIKPWEHKEEPSFPNRWHSDPSKILLVKEF